MDPYINGVPRFFAIMDDQPRPYYSSDLVHKNRFNLYVLDYVSSFFLMSKSYQLKGWPLDAVDSFSIPLLKRPQSNKKKLKIPINPNHLYSTRSFVYWETDYYVYVSDINMWVPVLDTEDRKMSFWHQPFRFTAEEDTEINFQERVLEQLSLREQMLNQTAHAPDPEYCPDWRFSFDMFPQTQRLPTRPPTPPRPSVPKSSKRKNSLPIPPFVAAALKRDAIAKNDACPISLSPFSECDSVSLTSCYHLFETGSIQNWLKTHSACPFCKEKVTSTVQC